MKHKALVDCGWRVLLWAGLCLGDAAQALAQPPLLSEPPAPPPPASPDAPFVASCPDGPQVLEVLPIDLATALRLVNESNPTIAVARQRVAEAMAVEHLAEVLWLPNLQYGPTYQRHDGQIQNSAGVVFTTSKSNVFIGGGAVMGFETSDALFAPLVTRRLTTAASAYAQATTNNVQLDVAQAYLDLLQVYGALAINEDTLSRASEMLRRAVAAAKAELSKTTADVPRARTEVAVREQERIRLRGQGAVASARLARLLLLRPTVTLEPCDPMIVPITLVDINCPLDDLVAVGLMNRPELAARRALVGAALARWNQAKVAPFVPRLELDYISGGFGGGRNDFIGDFNGRGDFLGQAVWKFSNLGAGDIARARERRTQYNEASFQVVETASIVGEEVTAAAQLALAERAALGSAQEGVRQALEMWRRLEKSSFGMVGPRAQYDALEPLLAEQALSQARLLYLAEVIEYNRAQFRLYTAMGQPPLCALPQATPIPLAVPVVPEPRSPDTLPQPRPLNDDKR